MFSSCFSIIGTLTDFQLGLIRIRRGSTSTIPSADPDGKLCILSYNLAPEARGRGTATQAVREVVRFCFERKRVDYILGRLYLFGL